MENELTMLVLMKRNLLSNDPSLQLVDVSDDNQQLNFVDKLIQSDIAVILCDCLAVNDSKILRLILSCLHIISQSKLFYTNNVAMQAICQILQNAYLMTKNSEKQYKTLRLMAIILQVFVSGADIFGINLNAISKIDQLLEFIDNLDVQNSTDPVLVLVVANLYSAVLPHVENFADEKMSSLIVKIHQAVLSTINEGILNNVANNDPTLEAVIRAVVKICDTGMKLCEFHDRSPNGSLEYPSNLNDVGSNDCKLIVDITRQSLLEIVIPNAKVIPVDDRQCIVGHSVSCLCQLYDRGDVDMKEISTQLLIQGYLKYLYAMMDSNQPNRETICDCIASTLVDFIRNGFITNEWSEGLQGFRRFIKVGLSVYSESDVKDIDSPASDAFLFFCYFHCLATRDSEVINIVRAMPLALRMKHLSADDTLEIPIFQVTWFLLAMSALENPSSVNCVDFPHAATRIIEIVENAGIEHCYTHHPALPCFVLQNSVFPEKMRIGVVKMWLSYEDSVHHLVPPERMQILVDTLLGIIQTGTERLVVRASNELLRMMGNGGNSTSWMERQITEMMWEKLPEVLIDFSTDREGGIGAYLKMLNRLSSAGVSALLAIRSSHNLISILIRKDLTITHDVQTLLVKQISKMLSVALAAQDGRVVLLFTNDYEVLNKVRVEAFSREHDNLSAACYECLATILHSQKQFSMKCPKPISLRPTDLFGALMRQPCVYFDALKFLDEIWVGDIEQSAVPCPTFTDNEAKEILTGIYRTYIRIHLNAPPTRWGFSFHCLTNLLKFCRKKYEFVLFECCDYICNHSVINVAICCDYSGESFFTFVNTWLRMALYSRCSHVIHSLKSKSLRDKNQSEKILFESTFDEAVQELSVYLKKLVAAGRLKRDDIKELELALGKFI